MSPASFVSQPLAFLQVLTGGASPREDGLAPGLSRGVIVELTKDGEIVVQLTAEASSRFRCDFLETGAGPHPDLGPGDLVLVLRPSAPGQNGCVLGRIGRHRPPQAEPEALPAHVVVEAGEMLTLKCGDSAIDLRKDGKLLIRGQDVVSRATRTQRIKGGTVAIN